MSILKTIFFSLLLGCMFSCTTPKKIVYFQNSTNLESIPSINNISPKYVAGDMLSIKVSAIDNEAARPFNLGENSSSISNSDTNTETSANKSIYILDSEGNIEFPVLGKLAILGLNRVEVQEMIKGKLKSYINKPIVSVLLKNFKITILGEVNSPGSYSIPNERITIIEAIGLARDLNIKGKRENITVIRETDSTKTYHKIDLTSKAFFDSPVYYLAQNDVIYVEPNKAQKKASKNNNFTRVLAAVSSVLSIVLSVIALSR